MSEDKSIPISAAALAAFAQADDAATPRSDVQRNDAHPTDETLSSHATNETFDHDDEHADEPVDPRFPITVLPGFCTRLAGSACQRCTFICPYDAISFDEMGAPHIDATFCTRCGLCCGVCDAFVTERITMNDLLDKVRRLSADGDPVFFTCYDQIPEEFEVHPNVIVLPCIGAVAPEFWTSALEIAPSIQIYCNFTLCEDCPTAGNDARPFFTHAVNLSEQWSRIHMGRAERLPEKTDILSRFFEATEEEFHRRGIASSLVNEVEDIASGKHRKRNSDTLANYHANREHLRAQGHVQNIHHHHHVPSTIDVPVKKTWPRLRMISTTVQDHPTIAPNIPRYLAAVDAARCDRCYEACFTHCPSGARSVDEEGAIHIDPQLCIACGNCALYCPKGAAFLFETNATIFLDEEPSE